MSKKSLLFGAIASVITINSVFADTIVTSKSYVDTTRQATIPAAETNIETPGVSVVTYTDTAGTIGERGVCDADANSNDDCENNYLVTRDLLNEQIGQATNLPTTTTTNKVCTEWVANAEHTDANCLLWNLTDQTVYGCLARGALCRTHSQCCNGRCNPGESFDTGYCN